MHLYLCVAPIKIQLISCAALQIVLHKASAGETIEVNRCDLKGSIANAFHLIDLRISGRGNCSRSVRVFVFGGNFHCEAVSRTIYPAPYPSQLPPSSGHNVAALVSPECGLSVCQGIKANGRWLCCSLHLLVLLLLLLSVDFAVSA